jgi:catechol 2,3-dioxygenase-like lactoylglutathione lyase family enzyme
MTESSGLPARISLVTLGVTDLARVTAFYRALGWPLTASSDETVSFFRTAGAILALFPTTDLAADAGIAPEGQGFRRVALAVNVDSPAAVVAALQAAVQAGGTIVKPGEKVFWGGYSSYFADPEGNLWEVAHNPGWPLDERGLPQLPPD